VKRHHHMQRELLPGVELAYDTGPKVQLALSIDSTMYGDQAERRILERFRSAVHESVRREIPGGLKYDEQWAQALAEETLGNSGGEWTRGAPMPYTVRSYTTGEENQGYVSCGLHAVYHLFELPSPDDLLR